MRSVFLKTLAVSAVLALIFACTKSENPSGGNTAYSISVAKFTARYGHEKVIETLTGDLEKTAASFVTADDSAAIAAIDSIVNLYNHDYVAGTFSLQKGVENGTRLNLKEYQLKMAGYYIVDVTENLGNPISEEKNEKAKSSCNYKMYTNEEAYASDSVAFRRQLDSLDIFVSVSDNESAMKDSATALCGRWSKKKTVLSDFALCKDDDTLEIYHVRVGENVVRTVAIGYEAMVGDAGQISNLKKEVAEALATYDKAGYSNLEVAANVIKIARKYNNNKVDGYLYLFRQYNDKAYEATTAADTTWIPYYNTDDPDDCYWYPWYETPEYFVNTTISSGPMTPHAWNLSMDYSLSIDTSFLKIGNYGEDAYSNFLTYYEFLRNALLNLRDKGSYSDIKDAFAGILDSCFNCSDVKHTETARGLSPEDFAMNGTYYTGYFEYSISGTNKETGAYVKEKVKVPVFPRAVINTDKWNKLSVDSLDEKTGKYVKGSMSDSLLKDVKKNIQNDFQNCIYTIPMTKSTPYVNKAEAANHRSYVTKQCQNYRTPKKGYYTRGKVWAKFIDYDGSNKTFVLVPSTFEGKDTVDALVYDFDAKK